MVIIVHISQNISNFFAGKFTVKVHIWKIILYQFNVPLNFSCMFNIELHCWHNFITNTNFSTLHDRNRLLYGILKALTETVQQSRPCVFRHRTTPCVIAVSTEVAVLLYIATQIVCNRLRFSVVSSFSYPVRVYDLVNVDML